MKNTADIAVSVIIFTLNEELHLPSCLASLEWCDDIIIVDSFSTDKTEEISRQYKTRFFRNKFSGFGSQRNWALENIDIRHTWVLILDADERVTEELAREIGEIAHADNKEIAAYCVKRRFYMWGKWLRYSSLYPTWVVRFIHKNRVRYIDRGHSETQEVRGLTEYLKNDLIDENLKGVHEWFERQNRYASKDAEYEMVMEQQPMHIKDLLSAEPLVRRAALKRLAYKIPFRPFFYFIYSYIWKRGFMEGKDGLYFCMMKSIYQAMIVVKKYDMRRLNKRI